MAKGLGIDTGGTYTDAALVDLDSKEILAKGKALTDHGNLCESIINSIEAVGEDALNADYVALSTTLATNAIVEGRGAPVLLIAIGIKPEIRDLLPPGETLFVDGGHRIDGSQAMELDEAALEKIARTIPQPVEAIAISSYLSVRNPEHELRAKSLIGRITDLPVVCGHELTTRLGYKERTATVLLNARLIPLSKNLFSEVKKALNHMGLTAPLMIVKSDGTLIDADEATKRPVQTILSGPAAGIAGALWLGGMNSGIVVDMGGTTMDLSIVQGGIPRLNREGATVGEWRTRVESVDVTTVGLGGDSYIWNDKQKKINIGPNRALPLSYLSAIHPAVQRKLMDLLDDQEVKRFSGELQDFIYRRTPLNGRFLNPQEKYIMAKLEAGPLLTNELFAKNRDARRVLLLALKNLEEMGIVGRAGLTPTDILNSNQRLGLWDCKASILGSKIAARYLGMEQADFEQKILDEMKVKIARSILKKEINECLFDGNTEFCEVCQKLIDLACCPQENEWLQVLINSRLPLIGVGAPIRAYLPGVAEVLGRESLIPIHAEVASAIGAVMANVVETDTLLIENSTTGGFNLYSTWGKYSFETLDQAKRFAIDLGVRKVTERAMNSGASHVKIMKNISEKNVTWGGENVTFIFTAVEITATGPPRF